ncbi:glycosyltransferase family 4 protein [Congregibacter variabilis]|uniref:Glycosyltransferase family 4 protein n=1 Tax=Congregibacter variabilis TaxID=3081200 RepID=A0ABZ0I733_9GAMM|nr:glycosyltransferase family 4 protein [Congregibacter sp. IMCC43200]
MQLSFGLLALALSLICTAIYLPLARQLRFLDAPNHRSAHAVITPSSGGLAVVIAIAMTLCVAQLSGGALYGNAERLMLLLLLGLCALGAWDDRHPLPVYLRLLMFFLVASAAMSAYLDLPFTSLWLLPALMLGLAWLINLYNFMDGIDGLAALQVVMVAGAMLGLGFITGASNEFLILCATTAGAYGGFLVFNWPPAKLFMGDAGSLSAGLLLGWLGLWSWRDEFMPLVVWFLLMSPFLLDTGITLLVRAYKGQRLTEAHSSHCYQRLARHWGSHRRVDYALVILHGVWLIPLALVGVFSTLPQWTLMLLGLFPQLLLIAKLRRFT